MDKIQKNSFLILVIVVILIRVGLFFTSQPQIAPDTPGYTNLANRILNLNLTDYSGERTPGYPLIIALAGMNLNIVMILQMVMGIIISISLYKIILILTRNKLLSLFSGLSYSLYLPQLYREAFILTETTATFFVVLSFLSFLYLIKSTNENRKKHVIYLLLTGLFSSLAALTRPILIIIPVVFGFFLLYFYIRIIKIVFRKIVSNIIIFLISLIILIGGWILIIYTSTGTFGLTTISGFTLMTKVDSFIESSPEECKEIPDYEMWKNIYIKKRNERIVKCGSTAMTIWRVREEMVDKRGISYAKASNIYGKIAKKTIINAPFKYFKTVVKDWIIFWKPMGIGDNVNPILKIVSKYFERVIFLFLEIFFLLFPLMYIFIKKFRDSIKPWNSIEATFIATSYAIILLISIGQALVIKTEARFSIPIEPILFLTVILILWKIFCKLKNIYNKNRI